MSEFIEPVNLSGGELGGTVVEGQGWAPGTERTFGGIKYRRDYVDMAVFTGVA
jgi:hypothetical protein